MSIAYAFFISLSSIPIYEYTTYPLNCSIVDGNLGCFQFRDIMSKASVNIVCVQCTSHCMDMDIISSLLDEPLEEGWLDHKIHPCVTFQETAQLFSKVVVPVYGSNSSTSLPTHGMVGLSNRL